jgi:hypothetical protein
MALAYGRLESFSQWRSQLRQRAWVSELSASARTIWLVCALIQSVLSGVLLDGGHTLGVVALVPLIAGHSIAMALLLVSFCAPIPYVRALASHGRPRLNVEQPSIIELIPLLASSLFQLLSLALLTCTTIMVGQQHRDAQVPLAAFALLLLVYGVCIRRYGTEMGCTGAAILLTTALSNMRSHGWQLSDRFILFPVLALAATTIVLVLIASRHWSHLPAQNRWASCFSLLASSSLLIFLIQLGNKLDPHSSLSWTTVLLFLDVALSALLALSVMMQLNMLKVPLRLSSIIFVSTAEKTGELVSPTTDRDTFLAMQGQIGDVDYAVYANEL